MLNLRHSYITSHRLLRELLHSAWQGDRFSQCPLTKHNSGFSSLGILFCIRWHKTRCKCFSGVIDQELFGLDRLLWIYFVFQRVNHFTVMADCWSLEKAAE